MAAARILEFGLAGRISRKVAVMWRAPIVYGERLEAVWLVEATAFDHPARSQRPALSLVFAISSKGPLIYWRFVGRTSERGGFGYPVGDFNEQSR